MVKNQSQSTMKNKTTTIKEAIVEVLDDLQDMTDSESALNGIPTGFIDIDAITSGLQSGDLIVLAARPSMGKTTLALNIAENISLHQGLPVVYFTLDSTGKKLSRRIVASLGRIDLNRLKTARLTDVEWPQLTQVIEHLQTLEKNFVFDESISLTIDELRDRAFQFHAEFGKLGLIVVDYFQLMNGMGNATSIENRSSELSAISRGLKALAKDLDCPIIALSQLNRSVDQRFDKRPILTDLRDCGSIEDDADVVMFIYRDEYYNFDTKEPGIAEVILGKQRDGLRGTVKLAYLGAISRFESLVE